jgi:hypothetical protein
LKSGFENNKMSYELISNGSIFCVRPLVFFNPDGADILLQSRRAKEIKATAGIGIVENAQALCFKFY